MAKLGTHQILAGSFMGQAKYNDLNFLFHITTASSTVTRNSSVCRISSLIHWLSLEIIPDKYLPTTRKLEIGKNQNTQEFHPEWCQNGQNPSFPTAKYVDNKH